MKWYNPRSWFNQPEPEKPVEQAPTEERIPGKFLVIQAGFEDDGQLRVEVEYDDTFVVSLRERGYVGVDDHQLVMQYVSDVYRTIATNADNKTYD